MRFTGNAAGTPRPVVRPPSRGAGPNPSPNEKPTAMIQLALLCRPDATTEDCALCGRPVDLPAGNGLCTAEEQHPVCGDCGRTHAPSLAALVNLADAAERISRIGRHSVFPPLSALLDLARAAEKYTHTVTAPRRRAG